MIWRRRYGFLCVFLLISISHAYARKLLEVDTSSQNEPAKTTNPHITSSISHILRSLSSPSSNSKPVHIITKSGIIETNRDGKGGRKLFFGEELPAPVPANVPAPVMVSSQTISINSAKNNSNTKRGRSLSTVGSDGVRTIEGIRVPDDEHDRFHTWRNARVIKNFLVENNRPANPHRKRQIVVSDARSLLSGQSVYTHGMGPTQATLIDVSSLTQQKLQQPQTSNVYYTQTAIPQSQAQILQGQDLTSALYAAAATQQQQQQQVSQQVYQYQAMANSPAAASTIALASGSQESAYSYNQPQQGQMYVLQPDGKTYLPYNPTTGQLVQQTSASDQTHTVSHVPSQLSQSQFQSRSSAEVDKNSAEVPHPLLQQHALRVQQEQQNKLREEQAYAQHILSKHRSHIEAEQADDNKERSAEATGQSGINPSQLTRKSSEAEIQHLTQIAATALPTGANIRQQLQQQVSAQTAQILHPHKNNNAQHAQVFHAPQNHPHRQERPHFQERPHLQERPHINAHPVNPGQQFVIQPHTYTTGGGQMFSVPVPIPVNQAAHHAQRERDDNDDKQERDEVKREKSTLTSKLMETLHMNINRRTAERVETSAVVPVLSSAGLILGLGALAAGWYLSKNNREVGILKKSGTPASKGSSTNGGKDHAVIAHLREKRGTDEVDQASFFQSIIQHGIEKQQQTYDPAPVQQYNPAPVIQQQQQPQQSYGQPPVNNVVRHDRVQTKPHSHSRVPGSHGHKGDNIVDKSGKGGGGITRVKNFANVAIPAVILGGSVLVIGALIVGWYISGANREIAFLEPSAYSRRKRSISSTTSFSDGWLHRILTSIHSNPYETEETPSSTAKDVAIIPHPFDSDTSKSTITDSDITSLTVAFSLAAFAFGALTVLGLAWYFTDNSRQVAWADKGPYSFGHWPTAYYGPRVRRSIATNDMTFDSMPENQGFLHKILDNLQVSQSSLLNKLHETGYSKWQETPCAQRIFCDVMSTQSDDTVRLMEKRMLNFLSMLPDSMSSSLSKTLGDVVNSINKRDCSAFTCGGHWVDSTAVPQPASQKPR